MDKIYKLYKLDKKACKSVSYDYDDFFKCMSKRDIEKSLLSALLSLNLYRPL